MLEREPQLVAEMGGGAQQGGRERTTRSRSCRQSFPMEGLALWSVWGIRQAWTTGFYRLVCKVFLTSMSDSQVSLLHCLTLVSQAGLLTQSRHCQQPAQQQQTHCRQLWLHHTKHGWMTTVMLSMKP